MSKRIFISRRSPRVTTQSTSSILPPGYSFVVDRDDVTLLTDSAGNPLVVANG